MPIRIGMPMKKTIVVPCIVNSWLNVSGAEEVVARPEQLPAHQQRLDAADDQEDHGHEDVQDADLLVIDGGHPVVEHGRPGRRRRLGLRSTTAMIGSSAIGHSVQASTDRLVRLSGASAGSATMRVAVAVAQAEGRHQAARLDLLRVGHPAAQVRRACSGSCPRRASAGSSGASGPGRRCPRPACRAPGGS